MMIRGTSMMLFMGGVILFVFAKLIPFLEYLSMDWIGVFMMGGAVFILLFCFSVSGTSLQYDTIPAGTSIINYIRRDGIIVPLLGKRIFTGESFLDVPGLGIIEDFGKDTVFLWGRKKVRFAIENISYTPDLKYGNYCNELHNLGFEDHNELTAIMNIDRMGYSTKEEQDIKMCCLLRMADIYPKLVNPPLRGAERLTALFRETPEKNTSFKGNQGVFKALKAEHDANKQQRRTHVEETERERLERLIGDKK